MLIFYYIKNNDSWISFYGFEIEFFDVDAIIWSKIAIFMTKILTSNNLGHIIYHILYIEFFEWSFDLILKIYSDSLAVGDGPSG